MTNLQTKKELNEEYHGVKYILTSNMRTRLILAIYEGSKNLDELRKELKKPSATILHGLKELETINLVYKSEKRYDLTSSGYLLATNMAKLIDNWSTLNNNKSFWNNHDLKGIPEDLLKKVYLLKNVEYVNSTTSDLSNAFNKYIKLISKTRTLKIILPIYSENHLKNIIKNLNNDKLLNLELITSKDILTSIKRNKTFRKKLLHNKNVKIICINYNPRIFLTYSSNFMSLTLFFKDGHYDDSQILIGKNENATKWAYELYNIYYRNGDVINE